MVDLSIDVQGAGSLDASGTTMDYVKVFYVINGGAETSLISQDGGFGDENWHNYSKTGLKGTSLKIVVRSLITGGGEYYYWDNIRVTTTDAINNAPAVTLVTPSNNTTLTAPATIDMSATASDPDGTVSKVEFYNGATKLGEDASSPYSYSWTNVQAGSYTIVAKATDNSGNTKTSASASVTIEAAVTTSDIWYEPFTGLADSTKVDNGTTAWTSTRTSGVFDVIASEFSITDGGGEGVWTSEAIDISGHAAVDLSIDVQGMGQLDASGGYLDYIHIYYVLNGGAETVLLDQNGVFTDENWHTYSKKGLSGTSLKVIVRALISGGDEYYYWDNIKVTAGAVVNTPPTVSLTAPLNNAKYDEPASVTISATASDAVGSISKVEFYNGINKIGEDASSPYSYVWTGVKAGSYSITAKAIDNNGASATTSAISITVNPTIGLDNTILEDVEIYPTYTTGIVYIRNADGAVWTLISASGNMFGNAKIEGGKIDISNIPDGMYILQIVKEQKLKTQRIVKQ